MLQVPKMTGADVAFGNIKHMPKYEAIPAEFKDLNNVFCRAVSGWFFNGAKAVPNGIHIGDTTLRAKPGVEANQALAAIRAILGSFEPKHEHKTAACAFLLAEWFDAKTADAA